MRAHANVVLTNPDMLHRSLLPGHARWSAFLAALRFVVIDECHAYRGVFGSHVAAGAAAAAAGLRRATAPSRCSCWRRRPCRTRRRSASRLVGLPVAAVTDDGSPRGATTFALWEPPLTDRRRRARGAGAPLRDRRDRRPAHRPGRRRRPDAGVRPVAARRRGRRDVRPASARRGRRRSSPRGSPPTAAATCRRSGARSSGAASRRARRPGDDNGARARHRRRRARRRPAGRLPGHPRVDVAAGRSRRARPAGTRSPCSSRATTRSTPTWCTTRRRCSAGRSRRPCSTRTTRTCSAPHLCAAAAELPLRRGRPRPVRPDRAATCSTTSSRDGLLRRRPTGWFWTRRERACDLADIRGTGGAPVRVVEAATGRLLGTVDAGAAHATRARRCGLPAPGRDLPRPLARPRRRRRAGRAGRPGLHDLRPRRHRPLASCGRSARTPGARRRWRFGEVDVTTRSSPSDASGSRAARCSARSRSTCRCASCAPGRCGGP